MLKGYDTLTKQEKAYQALAKLTWQDPESGETREFVLEEGATASIGRSENNDIQIAEEHVSRQHALISYRDGVFLLTDLDSRNGTFVNDDRIVNAFPLCAGDRIRLYVPWLDFSAANDEDAEVAEETGQLIRAIVDTGQGSLIVTNGPQEGQVIPLLLDQVRIGRAMTEADWEIMLQDSSVSRPHAQIQRAPDGWYLTDLASSNGTSINSSSLAPHQATRLQDGDILHMGSTILLFRASWQNAHPGVVPPVTSHYR